MSTYLDDGGLGERPVQASPRDIEYPFEIQTLPLKVPIKALAPRITPPPADDEGFHSVSSPEMDSKFILPPKSNTIIEPAKEATTTTNPIPTNLQENTESDDDEFLPTGWDATSSYASTSLTPSIYQHAYENGRRFHAYKHGRYPIPNDDLEQNREDMKHALMLELTDGKLFFAPIIGGEDDAQPPKKVIDVGTGTGIWAIEMGEQFPGSEVLGLDLSPIQPQWVPPNVRFVIDDVEDEWASGGGWDFVHFRSMALVLRDLQRAVDQSFRHLKPGGWIEFQESHGLPQCDDGTMNPETDFATQYYNLCQEAMSKFGMDLSIGASVGEYLTRAGFVNVSVIKKKAPLGMWPKDKTMRLIGLYTREIALHSIRSMDKPFANMGLNEMEREVWGAKMRAAVKDNHVHRYYNYYFWYAQKPEE
ncbi:Trans-aconitate 2-methyltransferase [Rhypophila sp. PSN 637]